MITSVKEQAENLFISPATVFKGFWHGPPLTTIHWACLTSFIRNGHRFQLYVYESMDVPKGVELKDAACIIPLKDLFVFSNPETKTSDLGPFSDLFRFKLLMETGGWWCDVDTICLSPEIPEVDRAWAPECPEVKPGAIAPGQISFAAGDPIICALYHRCKELSHDYQQREALGPLLITSVIRELNAPLEAFGSADTFFPLRWIEMYKLWLPEYAEEVVEKTRGALFLPIFQSFPTYIGLHMNCLPPPGCHLDALCRELVPERMNGDHYDADEVRKKARLFFIRKKEWAIDELAAVCGKEEVSALGLHKLPIQTAEPGFDGQVKTINENHAVEKNYNLINLDHACPEKVTLARLLVLIIYKCKAFFKGALNSAFFQLHGKGSAQSRFKIIFNLCLLFMKAPRQFLASINPSSIKAFIAKFNRMSPAALENKVRKKVDTTALNATGVQGGYFKMLAIPEEKRRVLVIDRNFHIGDSYLDAKRIQSVLQSLLNLKCQITLISDNTKTKNNQSIFKSCKNEIYKIETIYGPINFEEFFRKNGPRFAIVIWSGFQLAFEFMSLVRAYAVNSIVIYDSISCRHWIGTERAGRNKGNASTGTEPLRKTEFLNIACSDVIFAATQGEKDHWLQQNPGLNVHVVPINDICTMESVISDILKHKTDLVSACCP